MLNNDILSIISEYADNNMKYTEDDLIVVNYCHICRGKKLDTNNTAMICVLPRILRLRKDQLHLSYYGGCYTHLKKDYKKENVFGLIKFKGKMYNYDEFMLKRHTTSTETFYFMNWSNYNDKDVQIYADLSKTNTFLSKLIFSKVSLNTVESCLVKKTYIEKITSDMMMRLPMCTNHGDLYTYL